MNTVNSLIIDHIKQPDCLILVAINMIGITSQESLTQMTFRIKELPR